MYRCRLVYWKNRSWNPFTCAKKPNVPITAKSESESSRVGIMIFMLLIIMLIEDVSRRWKDSSHEAVSSYYLPNWSHKYGYCWEKSHCVHGMCTLTDGANCRIYNDKVGETGRNENRYTCLHAIVTPRTPISDTLRVEVLSIRATPWLTPDSRTLPPSFYPRQSLYQHQKG